MKFSLTKAALFATALILTIPVSAQKKKKGADLQGKFTYSLEVDDPNIPAEALSMFDGAEMIIIKGDGKTRTEVRSSVTTNITINDEKTGETWVFIDAMGNKFKMNATPPEGEEKEEITPEITYVDGEKTIAGYKCKKASIKLPGSDATGYVYYTEEFGGESLPNFNGLKGFPLEFEMNQGIHMVAVAKEVNLDKQDDKEFAFPEGFMEVTQEELQQMMGGGN